jgi:hypothetical protein
MKKIALLSLGLMMAAFAFAQNDPGSIARRQLALPLNIETLSAHNQTITPGFDVEVLTASRKDTIVLQTSLYYKNEFFTIICENSSNDSTLIIPSSGNILGATTFWFTGTYKHGTFWFDGTNYWQK